MSPTVGILFALSLIAAIAFSQAGCDKLSDFLKNFSNGQNKEESVQPAPAPSYEKTVLLDILAKQKDLLEQIHNARTFGGDKESIRQSYEEILRLDQSYQQEYAKDEAKLSTADCDEISRKHYEIIKSLPSPSSLMN